MKRFLKWILLVPVLIIIPVLISALPFGPKLPVCAGQSIFASGINVAWRNYANDVADTSLDTAWFTTMLNAVQAAGGNTVRWWLHTNGSNSPKFSAGLCSGNGSQTTANMQAMLDLAQARGITVIMSLFSFDLLQTGQAGVNQTNSTNLLTTDAGINAYITNSLNPMLAAVGNHPAVLCWEICNEPEGMSNEFGWSSVKVSMANLQKFHNRVAGAIHRAAPGARVTTGAASFQSLCNYFGGASKNYWTDAELLAAGGDADGYFDFYQVHYYDNWGAPGTTHSPFHHPASYWGLDKPIMVGEFRALGYNTNFTMTPLQCYNYLYDNGYAGAVSWTYTAHDGNGGLPDCASAITALKTNHTSDIVWNTSCNTTATITPTWSPSLDPNLYPFEDGTTMGWSLLSGGITAPQNSTTRSYLGTRSLTVHVTFTAAIAGGLVGTAPPLVTDVTGQTIVARIWVPADIPAGSGAQIYIKSGATWCWQNGIWTNLIPGIWNIVYFDTTHPLNQGAGTPNQADVRELGVKIAPPGGYTGTWNGGCFIDSVNVGLGAAPTPTPTATINLADPTLYPFETGTTMGWTTVFDQITASANSSAQKFWGNSSLAVTCNFTTIQGGNVGTQTPLVTNLTGKVLVARVWIPLDAPEFCGGYIYIKSGLGWIWQNAQWTTFTRGQWNEIYFDIDNPYASDPGVPDHAAIKEIGVKIGPPGTFVDTWAGTVFIDSVDVWNDMPTPTVTSTRTPTSGSTNTNTPTRTGTRTATYTATHSPTGTPANTSTNTVTVTFTRTSTSTNIITNTSTQTITMTHSFTATRTASGTPSASASASPSPTGTRTATPSRTVTDSPTSTNTKTATATVTVTLTETPYAGTPTLTDTVSATPTITETGTITQTATVTPTAMDTPVCVCAVDLGRLSAGTASMDNPGYIDTNKYTLIENAVARSLSVNITASSGGSVRLAIYSDNAGVPGNLIVETAASVVSAGWNTLDIVDTVLAAGDYWFAIQSEAGVIVNYITTAAADDMWIVNAFGAFPASITGATGWNAIFAIYLNYCPVVCGSPTNTMTVTLTPTITMTPTITLTPSITLTPTITPTIILFCACPDKLGMTYQGSVPAPVTSNFMLSNWYPMLEDGAAMSMEFFAASGSGNARVAIYSNSLPGLTPGVPANLICQSAPFAVTLGWNIVPIPQTDLSANTMYWLTVVMDSVISIAYDTGAAGDMYFKPSVFGPFPGVFGSGTSSSEDFSINVNYCPASCPLTATPTGTLTPTVTDTQIVTPTNTPAVSATNTPPGTLTNTPVVSVTDTPTVQVNSPTITQTRTITSTPTITLFSPTYTYTATVTNTVLPATATPTPTLTLTLTHTSTDIPTLTNTPTITLTRTPAMTFTPTQIPTLPQFEIEDPIAFPNPANLSAGITIGFNPTQDCAKVTVSIYTAGMRLIRKISVADAPAAPSPALPVKRTISLTDLKGMSNGVYYYVISGESNSKTKRSVIKKLVILK